MRHPFRWHQNNVKEKYVLFVWLDVWAHIFEIFARQEIEAFVIINYEVLLSATNEVSQEITQTINNACFPSINESLSRQRRRLELHKRDKSSYVKLKKTEIKRWDLCKEQIECKNLMEDLSPIISEFGYTWDMENPF